ncbi:MAG: hypothetical protein KatS3mg068_0003 [Candidatus Sericytochromatia bacterium]|nr:MAG: hypothetical protein KatS3mg068_0003 [Candidatus Sericytochromatia bacterium]
MFLYIQPLICDFINNNLYSAEKLFSQEYISFRIKEREWIYTNIYLDYKKYNLFFVRISISSEYFNMLKNRSPEFIKILAQRKNLNLSNRKNYITCTENIFLEEKHLENIYLNPDIVFMFN